jgi:hypothetical protein
MSNLPTGFSLQINGGTVFGGFHTNFTKHSWRVCIGYVAVTLFFYDVEPVLAKLIKESK